MSDDEGSESALLVLPSHHDVVIPPGVTSAVRHLHTDAQMTIGAWHAVTWEIIEGREGPNVPFAVEVVRLADGGYEDVLFSGEALRGTSVEVVNTRLPADAKLRVSWRLPQPRDHATNARLHLTGPVPRA